MYPCIFRSRFLNELIQHEHTAMTIDCKSIGGAVWPTAIYWTTVQVGTPARDFPVAIDSGSGDLDIGGEPISQLTVV